MSRHEPARRLDLTPAFLSDLLTTLTERGRALLRGKFSGNGETSLTHQELIQLGETLLSRRGEAVNHFLKVATDDRKKALRGRAARVPRSPSSTPCWWTCAQGQPAVAKAENDQPLSVHPALLSQASRRCP